MDDLPFDVAEQPVARTVVGSPKRCRRHVWSYLTSSTSIAGVTDGDLEGLTRCSRCGRPKDEVLSRRGKQSRNYGNRAELDVARRYGGEKIGHAGGPVDVRGKEWNVQVKTHRRNPPTEWTVAFAKMAASTDRLPRLLLRFVRPGNAPEDYFVVPAKAWLDWHGKDE